RPTKLLLLLKAGHQCRERFGHPPLPRDQSADRTGQPVMQRIELRFTPGASLLVGAYSHPSRPPRAHTLTIEIGPPTPT
ncbi:MAG: hypothetical protein WD360_04065, partial [Nitriliruptoraceae bacterium]